MNKVWLVGVALGTLTILPLALTTMINCSLALVEVA